MSRSGVSPSAAWRRLLVPAVATLAAGAVLVSLGVWQLQRLAWKDGLIAEIETRIKGPPQALPPEAEWARLVADSYEYRHVRIEGVFDPARRALVYRPDGVRPAKARGPGYLVMTPLQLASGAIVIVDRGYVPVDERGRVAPPATGSTSVTGLMRQPEPRNFMTPADEPARDLWFTRDPVAMGRWFGLTRVAPFSIDADATLPVTGWPVGSQTVTAIPNDHLVYAMTWFGLAATLLGVFGAYARGHIKLMRGVSTEVRSSSAPD